MAPLSLLLLPLLSVTTHAQSSRIQDLVTKLRSAPGHQSHSPSYTSQRKFEVIGSGELPLQSSGPVIAEEKEAEGFYGFEDNDSGSDADSLYLLVGAEHEFSETTVGVIRVGGQYYSPDHGDESWSPYIEGTIRTQVNEQLGMRAFVYYGNTARNRNIWIHDCDAIGSFPDMTANALYNDRKILRIGSQASYVVSHICYWP